MDFLNGLESPSADFLGLNFVFKLLFFVILIGYVFYSFLLVIRVRILADTVETPHGKKMQLVAVGHMVLSIVGGFLALLLILLA